MSPRLPFVLALALLALAPRSVRAQAASDDPAAAPVDTTIGASSAASEDDARQVASNHFRMGVSLYEEGDFQAALAEFEQAYAAAPSHVVLYNIAQTHLALRDYAAASDALRTYLEIGGDRVPEARRADVALQLETIERRVGRLHFECNVEGATITIDGRVVGTTPLSDPVRVSSGRHNVVVRAPGRDPDERTLTVAGDTDTTIEVEFADLPPALVRTDAPTSRPLRTWGYVGIGVGAASGVGAATTFSLAMRARSDYRDATATIPSDEVTARAARDDVRRFALASDVLTGVGIAAGAAGIVLVLVDRNRHSDSEESEITTVVIPSRNGLNVVGRF